MAKEYAHQVEGAYASANGPESIAESFPILTLEEVYGAVAFYLASQQGIDAYLRDGDGIGHQLAGESQSRNVDLIARLQRARHERQISG
jgi:hypothetical protein